MSIRNSINAAFLAAALAVGGFIGSAAAETAATIAKLASGTPNSAIFIGNSFFYYNNGINAHLSGLVRAADATSKLRLTMVTISGSGMNWHDVESYFRPEAIGSYSFTATNDIVFNKPNKLFDVAIVMDCSQCPIHPKLAPAFKEYAKKNSDTIRKHDAEPVFFMSWAYADKPEMTAQLAEAYTAAGNEHKALVIPAGLAFARVKATNPEINMYATDKRHPSLAGSYLAACSTYASLYKKSPEGSAYTAGLDPAVAKLLQAAAWSTEQAYHGQ